METVNYPMHDTSGGAGSVLDAPVLSEYSPAFELIDRIESEIAKTRADFCRNFAMVFDKSEGEAMEIAYRLESKGAMPDDLPFMRKYAAAFEDARVRKCNVLSDNPVPAAIIALVPRWRPAAMRSSGVTLDEIAAELRATRYINEQLLLRLHAMQLEADAVRADITKLRERTVPFLFSLQGVAHVTLFVAIVEATFRLAGTCSTGQHTIGFAHTTERPVGCTPDQLGIVRYRKSSPWQYIVALVNMSDGSTACNLLIQQTGSAYCVSSASAVMSYDGHTRLDEVPISGV